MVLRGLKKGRERGKKERKGRYRKETIGRENWRKYPEINFWLQS